MTEPVKVDPFPLLARPMTDAVPYAAKAALEGRRPGHVRSAGIASAWTTVDDAASDGRRRLLRLIVTAVVLGCAVILFMAAVQAIRHHLA